MIRLSHVVSFTLLLWMVQLDTLSANSTTSLTPVTTNTSAKPLSLNGVETRRRKKKTKRNSSTSSSGSSSTSKSKESLGDDELSSFSWSDSDEDRDASKQKNRKHRICTPCPEDHVKKWKDPSIRWICGAYQRARRSFKSECMMYYRNCQDGTMFTKLHDHRCANDTAGNPMRHGEHFFYEEHVRLSDESSDSQSTESDSSISSSYSN